METELYLINYDGQTIQALPNPITVYGSEMIPVASRSQCHADSFSSFFEENSLQERMAAYRVRSSPITAVQPSQSLVKFKLSAAYVDRYTCFKIWMSDQSGSRQKYFHASIRQIAKPSLAFDYIFYRDLAEDKPTAQLWLFSYNDKSGSFMPANALADVVQEQELEVKPSAWIPLIPLLSTPARF